MSMPIATIITATPNPALTPIQTSTTEVPSTVIIVTSIVTVTPSVTRIGGLPTFAITIDAQPSECSSRWALAYSAGSTILTSGNYPGTVFNDTVAPGYWRTCYPNAPTGTETPVYSPAMCTGQRSVTNVISAVDSAGSTPTTVWSALCCPR